KGLSAIPHSTVGYERMFNWGLATQDEEEFVRAVLAGQPEPPKYFAEMKRINRDGPRVLGGLRRPQRLPETRLAGVLEEGAPVVDARSAAEFAAGHVPGTMNIPLNRSFTTWAGWLVPYDRDFYLLLDDAGPRAVDEAVRDLAMIGLDRVAGYFGVEAVGAWAAEGRELQTVPQITAAELAERLRDGSSAVLDVRGAAEWEAGHLPGVENIPVGYLADRLDEVPRDRPLVLQCQAGARSAIAASVLQAKGFRNVVNLAGGYADWQAGGHPEERGAAAAALAGGCRGRSERKRPTGRAGCPPRPSFLGTRGRRTLSVATAASRPCRFRVAPFDVSAEPRCTPAGTVRKPGSEPENPLQEKRR
ncbi:MAG TPA: rhodanese-like domain-containing protein, partial [Longimicrobiaceae bacterium]|nr:rhodanese-like domain-containing protein [Longimicrobiaceae bacterium]